MRAHFVFTLLCGALLVVAAPAGAGQAGRQGATPAGKQTGKQTTATAGKRTAKRAGARQTAGSVGRGVGSTGALTARCQPLGRQSIQTTMRDIELAKESNDPTQMRQALDKSEALMGEIVDSMEHCNATAGAYQQEMTQNPGGIIPNSAGGGTPGTASRAGARQSNGPPENKKGGEGNWPANLREGVPNPDKP